MSVQVTTGSTINQVTIYGRADCCQGDLGRYQILVSNAAGELEKSRPNERPKAWGERNKGTQCSPCTHAHTHTDHRSLRLYYRVVPLHRGYHLEQRPAMWHHTNGDCNSRPVLHQLW